MRYLSTRGQSALKSFCDILLGGLAADGGLYLPTAYPSISRETLDEWRGLPYHELAFNILSLFIDDIPADDLRDIARRTYTPEVYRHSRVAADARLITPLVRLDDELYLQELSNGPTLAFKDMAMQLLGNLFEYVLGQRKQSLNILGATSGDTGSAAEYAMRGKHNVRVFMLSPDGKMSAFQRAQMYSLDDPNIFNIAVRGMFDDAQDIVKAVSNDAEFKAKYAIGAVNSINWARVLAQIVYYFQGYFLATENSGETVAFTVPSGNFGNICAGHIARQMGLPIKRLVLATNENNVLDEFFRTGVYRPRTSAETFVTSSPSMDISKASNFERFIYDFVNQDKTVVRNLWNQVDRGEAFDLSGTVFWKNRERFGFISGQSTHADRLATIRLAQEKYQVLIDPHTADALKVALRQRIPGEKMVVLETAQPVKFSATIQEAIGSEPPRPADFAGLESLPQHFCTLDAKADLIKSFIAERVAI